jgi:inosine/xanthosine triphosphate pyrophosphatase family protein
VRFHLATTNPAKVTALAERVGAGIEIVALPIGPECETAEELDSFKAIAKTQAICVSRAHPAPLVVASDGGLTIPSLGGSWDPVRTARFAGGAATSIDRAFALLDVCSDLFENHRQIGWTEALAVARDGEVLETWTAHSPPGLLSTDLPANIDPESGFWIPWLWCCPEYGNRRFSELTDRERLQRRDHWAILGEYLTRWARDLPNTG